MSIVVVNTASTYVYSENTLLEKRGQKELREIPLELYNTRTQTYEMFMIKYTFVSNCLYTRKTMCIL